MGWKQGWDFGEKTEIRKDGGALNTRENFGKRCRSGVRLLAVERRTSEVRNFVLKSRGITHKLDKCANEVGRRVHQDMEILALEPGAG